MVINGTGHVHPRCVGLVLYTCSYCYMCSVTHEQNEDGSFTLLRNNEKQRRTLAKSLLSNEN